MYILKKGSKFKDLSQFIKKNWEGFKSYIRSSDTILKNHDTKTGEAIWLSLKTVTDKEISQSVPIKIFGSKRSLPWIT